MAAGEKFLAAIMTSFLFSTACMAIPWVLSHVRRASENDGMWMIVEPFANEISSTT